MLTQFYSFLRDPIHICWLPLALLLCQAALAQQSDPMQIAAEDAEPVPEVEEESSADQMARNRVIYVDIPFVYTPGVDPVLPPAQLTNQSEPNPNEDRARSIQRYQNIMEEIEAGGGVWDPGLIEQLSAHGSLMQQQGDHDSAVLSLDRAMHISRINQGLHTTEQIPIVMQLIESYLALQDWSNADLYYNYLFYVQHRAYGAEDPRMIPVMAQLAHWHLQAFNMGFGETLGLRLSSAQILLETAARLVQLHFGRQDERFVSYLQSIADSAYLVARNPDLMAELTRADFLITQDLLAARLNQGVLGSPVGFEAGESALLEVISVFEEAANEPWPLAEAHANLGDWYLMFQKRRAAEEHYKQAWNLLADQDNGEALLQCLFGQVIAIPTFITEPRLLFRGSERPSAAELMVGFLDLSFTVTRNGEVRQVQFLGAETVQNDPLRARVVRELRRFLFRPRVVDGLTVASEDNYTRIRYWY